MTASVAAFLLCLLPYPQIQNSERNFAMDKTNAYYLMPPVAVCNSDVRSMVWSADSKHLLAIRDAVNITPAFLRDVNSGSLPAMKSIGQRNELYMWDAATNSSKLIWTLKSPSEQIIESAQWLGTSTTVIATLYNPTTERYEVVTVNLAGKVTPVLNVQEDHAVEVYASPAGMQAALLVSGAPVTSPEGAPPATAPFFSLYVLNNGVLSQQYRVRQLPYQFKWTANGKKLLAVIGGEFGSRIPVTQFDFASGTLVKAGELADDEIDLTLTDLYVQATSGVSATDLSAPTIILRTRRKEGVPDSDSIPGIVTSDGTKPVLSPNGEAVAYSHQGDCMVRRIVKVDKAAYLKAKEDAERAAALSRAKQNGLALIMFSNDWDDVFPSNEGWQDKVQPYLRSRDMMDGFNYTFGGGPMGDIKDPSKAMLGFVNGPGGKAVVYADGHAKWIPN